MGCCVSSGKNQKPKAKELQQCDGKEEQAGNVGSVSLEEETVKEVLLETPVMTTIDPMPPEIIRSTTPAVNPHCRNPLKDEKGIVPEIDRADYSEIRCYKDEVRKQWGPTGGMLVTPPRNSYGGGRVRTEGPARRSKPPATRVGRDKSEERSMKPLEEESPRKDVVLGEDAESLDNPVVSLECFIFL